MGGGGGGGGNNFDFFDSADDFTKMLLPFLRSNVNKFPCTFALYFFQCKNFKENEVKGNCFMLSFFVLIVIFGLVLDEQRQVESESQVPCTFSLKNFLMRKY